MNREQIEKAAKDYRMSLPYCDDPKIRGMFVGGYDGFIKGAEWRINSVWHPNTENPNAEIDKYGYGKDCLVQVKYKTLIELVEVLFENDTYVFLGERETYKMDEVVRWAYVSDLMSDGKEE